MLKKFKEFKLPQIEEKVLENWKENQVFKKLQDKKSKIGPFRFYEGPPYANGHPGIHHVLSRVFKDIILRYKSMSGYSVPRQAGWDTHGLPIEIQVEKELGIKSKKEIEKLGVSLFNKKAREIIWKYLDEWERFTERIGYWLDLKNPYITCDNSYIESLWWIFKKVHQRGFLKESRKIVPYCPRCETPLSSHELGQPGVYKLTKDPSVFIKFKLKNRKNEYLLVWTTTPWTLPSNVAVAVDPKLTYTKYKVGNYYLWSYSLPPRLSGNVEVMEKLSGRKLVGQEYEPLYKTLPKDASKTTKEKVYRVVVGDFIKTEEGTGLVHISPAFGEDDFNLLGSVDFPITIDNQGKMMNGLPGAGKFIKDADKDVSFDLLKRNLLYFEDKIEHEYPFCWRCSTPLIYFAKVSWFFEVSRLRNKLVSENEKINWIPSYIKNGRFGEWIKEAKDWAISRDRYWGTALPIWKCDDCKTHEVVGSLDELAKKAYHKNKFVVLRHGEADHNVKNLIAAGSEKGDHISRLTEKGKDQILRAIQAMEKKQVSIIFTSPYKRTLDTAEIVAKELGISVIVDKRLKEINCGIFNWRKISEYKKFFQNPLEKFTKAPPSGETLSEVKIRIFDFIKDVNTRYKNETILIVGHGDPLWVLEGSIKNLSRKEYFKLPYIDVGESREVVFKNLPYNEVGEIDIHRPYIDQIYLECDKCGGRMKRIPDVADVWFDSGAMPFASVHYPFENKLFIEKQGGYPADYICEAVDQTRGWFYTLMAVAVLLGRKKPPYRNVISLGLIRDKYGQKMSKSKGNVVEPMAIIQKYGVDAVRWYFYTANPPAEPKDFDEQELAKTLRKFFLILYNSYVFYESVGGGKVKPDFYIVKPSHVMDRWIFARLNETIEAVTKNLESYEIGGSARLIESLVDDLSRWYIRRSRRRLEMKNTLGFTLLEISKLIAPFAPFFGDALYQSLSSERQSVHLSKWPETRKPLIDKGLLKSMQDVRDLAAAALAIRNETSIKVRQPLASLKIKNPRLHRNFDGRGKSKINNNELLNILKEEINVKEIIFDDKIENDLELDTEITPELKWEGIVRELVRAVQELRRSAKLTTKNRIYLFIEATHVVNSALESNLKFFIKEVGAKSVEFKKVSKFDAEIETKIDSAPVWLAIKKA